MKAATYINRIKKENVCSIHTAELLTKALHREGVLHKDLVLRFKLLYGEFDIVHKSWFTNSSIIIDLGYSTSDPDNIVPICRVANTKYAAFNLKRCLSN